jgi:hypothetical protein
MSLIIAAALSFLSVPPAIAAGPAALPPPSHDGHPPATEPASPQDKSGLKKDLAPPGEQQDVQVRSYQKPDGTGITEYSLHGRTYMIKVQPPGGLPPYYLYDTNGDGRFNRRLPGDYKMISPPTWVIHRF